MWKQGDVRHPVDTATLTRAHPSGEGSVAHHSAIAGMELQDAPTPIALTEGFQVQHRTADSTSLQVKDLQGGLASDYELEDELGHGGTSPQLSSGDAERGAASSCRVQQGACLCVPLAVLISEVWERLHRAWHLGRQIPVSWGNRRRIQDQYL